MKQDINSYQYLFIGIIISIVSFFTMLLVLQNAVYKQDYNLLEQKLKQVNEARIEANNKPCCQVIQERYIDKRLDESGLNFIYEERPSIVECS